LQKVQKKEVAQIDFNYPSRWSQIVSMSFSKEKVMHQIQQKRIRDWKKKNKINHCPPWIVSQTKLMERKGAACCITFFVLFLNLGFMFLTLGLHNQAQGVFSCRVVKASLGTTSCGKDDSLCYVPAWNVTYNTHLTSAYIIGNEYQSKSEALSALNKRLVSIYCDMSSRMKKSYFPSLL
jgi:hypothetical protein